MNQKQVMIAFSYLYFGVWFFLLVLYLPTTSYNDFYSTIQYNLSIYLVLSIFPIYFIVFGLWKLKQNDVTIRINKKTIKNVKVIPIIVGFVLICVGIGFASLYKPVTYNIVPTGFAWLSLHPLGVQGLLLFWVGTGIQFLELVWFYDSVTSKPLDVKPS